RYFESSSFCGLVSPARTSAPNSDAGSAVRACVSMLGSLRSCELVSVGHATETRVHVGIVRLKPVTERAAQHAGGRARGPAFHDEVLVVEEVGGVSAIER